jgi:hypothetical protein
MNPKGNSVEIGDEPCCTRRRPLLQATDLWVLGLMKLTPDHCFQFGETVSGKEIFTILKSADTIGW